MTEACADIRTWFATASPVGKKSVNAQVAANTSTGTGSGLLKGELTLAAAATHEAATFERLTDIARRTRRMGHVNTISANWGIDRLRTHLQDHFYVPFISNRERWPRIALDPYPQMIANVFNDLFLLGAPLPPVTDAQRVHVDFLRGFVERRFDVLRSVGDGVAVKFWAAGDAKQLVKCIHARLRYAHAKCEHDWASRHFKCGKFKDVVVTLAAVADDLTEEGFVGTNKASERREAELCLAWDNCVSTIRDALKSKLCAELVSHTFGFDDRLPRTAATFCPRTLAFADFASPELQLRRFGALRTRLERELNEALRKAADSFHAEAAGMWTRMQDNRMFVDVPESIEGGATKRVLRPDDPQLLLKLPDRLRHKADRILGDALEMAFATTVDQLTDDVLAENCADQRTELLAAAARMCEFYDDVARCEQSDGSE